jgi:response regulator RpfG family c-di-GMP phosphodiesterase
MLDDGELIDAAQFPPMVMGVEPTQGRVRAIVTRQPEIITNYPAVLEKATGDVMVRVGVSRDERDTGAAMYVPMVARGQVIGLLEVQSYRLNAYGAEHAALLGPVANQIGLSVQNAQLYEEAQRELAERKRAEGELQHTLEKLREALGGIIQTVALTVETRDPYTAGHQRRVSNLARAIATEMGLSEEQIDGIRMAAAIHDLGKINIPTDILSKPGQLSEHEFGIIKCHPRTGYDILKTVEFPWPIAQMVFQHHERMDGSGYPQGLSGEEIILGARILAVADVVEAMASFRPYRPARGLDKALEEISQNRGVLYGAEVVDACLKLLAEERFTFE